MKAQDKTAQHPQKRHITRRKSAYEMRFQSSWHFSTKEAPRSRRIATTITAVLTECTAILEKRVSRLFGAYETVKCSLDTLVDSLLRRATFVQSQRSSGAENGQQQTDLEQAMITCQEFRRKLCLHQVDLMTAVSKESKSRQQQRRRPRLFHRTLLRRR